MTARWPNLDLANHRRPLSERQSALHHAAAQGGLRATVTDTVGGEIEIICDGGVRRGTHILKALAASASCASGGRLYLYALAAAGQAGFERATAL